MAKPHKKFLGYFLVIMSVLSLLNSLLIVVAWGVGVSFFAAPIFLALSLVSIHLGIGFLNGN